MRKKYRNEYEFFLKSDPYSKDCKLLDIPEVRYTRLLNLVNGNKLNRKELKVLIEENFPKRIGRTFLKQ